MSSSILSSLKHKVQPSVLDLIKHELRINWTASKYSHVDLLILALIHVLRFEVILAQKIGRKV